MPQAVGGRASTGVSLGHSFPLTGPPLRPHVLLSSHSVSPCCAASRLFTLGQEWLLAQILLSRTARRPAATILTWKPLSEAKWMGGGGGCPRLDCGSGRAAVKATS